MDVRTSVMSVSIDVVSPERWKRGVWDSGMTGTDFLPDSQPRIVETRRVAEDRCCYRRAHCFRAHCRSTDAGSRRRSRTPPAPSCGHRRGIPRQSQARREMQPVIGVVLVSSSTIAVRFITSTDRRKLKPGRSILDTPCCEYPCRTTPVETRRLMFASTAGRNGSHRRPAFTVSLVFAFQVSCRYRPM